METDGSAVGTSTSSMSDLKGLIKESLHELLQDEPTLFSRASAKAPGNTERGAHGGKFSYYSGTYVPFCSVLLLVVPYTSAPVGGHVAAVDGTVGELAYSAEVMCRCLSAGDELGALPDPESVRQLGLNVVGEGGDSGGGVVGDSGGEGPSSCPPLRPDSESKGAVGKPFVLSEGLPPVPHKLVAWILHGEFVDMAELLRDNLEAQRRSSST